MKQTGKKDIEYVVTLYMNYYKASINVFAALKRPASYVLSILMS